MWLLFLYISVSWLLSIIQKWWSYKDVIKVLSKSVGWKLTKKIWIGQFLDKIKITKKQTHLPGKSVFKATVPNWVALKTLWIHAAKWAFGEKEEVVFAEIKLSKVSGFSFSNKSCKPLIFSKNVTHCQLLDKRKSYRILSPSPL